MMSRVGHKIPLYSSLLRLLLVWLIIPYFKYSLRPNMALVTCFPVVQYTHKPHYADKIPPPPHTLTLLAIDLLLLQYYNMIDWMEYTECFYDFRLIIAQSESTYC
jgi:hypothetical protein